MEQGIEEGNKSIQDFMGWRNVCLNPDEEDGEDRIYEFHRFDYKGEVVETDSGGDSWCWGKDQTIPYHRSFDWLSHVFQKICELGYTVQWTITDGATCRIWKYLETAPSCGIIITDRPWTSVVKFIKWYNNQNKKA